MLPSSSRKRKCPSGLWTHSGLETRLVVGCVADKQGFCLASLKYGNVCKSFLRKLKQNALWYLFLGVLWLQKPGVKSCKKSYFKETCCELKNALPVLTIPQGWLPNENSVWGELELCRPKAKMPWLVFNLLVVTHCPHLCQIKGPVTVWLKGLKRINLAGYYLSPI